MADWLGHRTPAGLPPTSLCSFWFISFVVPEKPLTGSGQLSYYYIVIIYIPLS